MSCARSVVLHRAAFEQLHSGISWELAAADVPTLGPISFCLLQVDTMIVQAIALLDDLDKELNTYAMRVREWYGWHFPEMTKIVTDNIQYAKTVRTATKDSIASSCNCNSL